MPDYQKRGSSDVPCVVCGKVRNVIHAILKKGYGRYCSRKCKGIAERGTLAGPKNGNWKGGRTIIAGRPCLYIPSHPRATKEGYVYENVVVMERKLGRPLRWIRQGHNDNEVAHHINEDRMDNRIENLQLMTSKEHKQLHSRRQRKRAVTNNTKGSRIRKGRTWEVLSPAFPCRA
jgi:hypothetical protein